MPVAPQVILLGIAAVLMTLALRGYLRERALNSQHRTWLIIAGIFTVVSAVTTLLH